MGPNIKNTDYNQIFIKNAADPKELLPNSQEHPVDEYKIELVWLNVILHTLTHIAAVYGFYLGIFSAKWLTNIFTFVLYMTAILGVTAGVHRLWSHRTYKAKRPLQVILLVFYTIAFQDTVVSWVRNHRMHHKYSDTDADPHNARRGFFFSHFGWLVVKRHPEFKRKRDTVDLSDLYADPLLKFHKKYYFVLLMPLLAIILPTMIPVYFWNESWLNAFYIGVPFRYVWTVHATATINSFAHKWGGKPYDKNIVPTENNSLSLLTLGEGFHNYHHTFPWDYKAAELGNYKLNLTTAFINFFAKIGWAYDLKMASEENIQSRVKRTGDGSHQVWGWNDKDLTKEEAKKAIRINRTGDERS